MDIPSVHPPLAIAALLLAALWGTTFRACWQQVYHFARQHERPAPWAYAVLCALVLSGGLWAGMVLVIGALDLGVPVVTSGAVLLRSLACVTALHLAAVLMAVRMPQQPVRQRQLATVLAMAFSGGIAMTMLHLVLHLHLAPQPRLAMPAFWGLAVVVLSIGALSYRQVNNRWVGGTLTGVLVWLLAALMAQAVSWPQEVYYLGAAGAPALASLSVPFALTAATGLTALLVYAWIQRAEYRISSRPLPDVTPNDVEVAALAETTAQEMFDERHRRDVLYDRVLRHSGVRFWAHDPVIDEYRFRGAYRAGVPAPEADVVMSASEWQSLYVHPEDVVTIRQALSEQLASTGSFDVLHRLRTAPGQDDWRWVISRGTVVQRDALGQPAYIVGTHVDVTEQHELQSSIERDGRLFSDGPIVMVRWLFNVSSAQATELDFISPNIERLWGYTLDEVYASGALSRLVEAQDLQGFGRKLLEALKDGTHEVRHEFRIRLKDGRVLWHSLYARLEARDGDGYVSGFIVDIDSFKRTEQRTVEQARQLQELVAELQRAKDETAILRESSEFLNSAESMDEAFHIISRAAGRIFPGWGGALASSDDPARLQLTGRWGEAEAFTSTFSPTDCWALRRGQTHYFLDEGSSLRCRHVQTPADHPLRPYLCIPMTANGENIGSLHLMSPSPLKREDMVPQIERANRLGDTLKLSLSNLRLRAGLRQQATHDGLTGLYNRRFMDDRLPIEIKRCEREDQTVALAMIDVDHFKRINDDFGHEAGDAVLRALGELLLRRSRVYDLACRYGGEELVLIMPGCVMPDAQEKLESIRLEVASMKLRFGDTALPPVTISVGLAETFGGAPEALLKQADERLYRAKRSGRNRLVMSNPEEVA